jgi:DnaJ-class molecular chaperone
MTARRAPHDDHPIRWLQCETCQGRRPFRTQLMFLRCSVCQACFSCGRKRAEPCGACQAYGQGSEQDVREMRALLRRVGTLR